MEAVTLLLAAQHKKTVLNTSQLFEYILFKNPEQFQNLALLNSRKVLSLLQDSFAKVRGKQSYIDHLLTKLCLCSLFL